VTERVAGFRQMLQDILTVNATLVGTVYCMNFDHMPELNWAVGAKELRFHDASSPLRG
jgi:hypothetical protein